MAMHETIFLPQGLAVTFNKQNKAIFESRKEAIEKRKEEKRLVAQGLKQQLVSCFSYSENACR